MGGGGGGGLKQGGKAPGAVAEKKGKNQFKCVMSDKQYQFDFKNIFQALP